MSSSQQYWCWCCATSPKNVNDTHPLHLFFVRQPQPVTNTSVHLRKPTWAEREREREHNKDKAVLQKSCGMWIVLNMPGISWKNYHTVNVNYMYNTQKHTVFIVITDSYHRVQVQQAYCSPTESAKRSTGLEAPCKASSSLYWEEKTGSNRIYSVCVFISQNIVAD